MSEALKQRRIGAFLRLAAEERQAATNLAAPLPRQALYFVQQAVEKLLRAVLEFEERPAGASHNIRYLLELLPEEHALRERFEPFDTLSVASTRYRYPSASGSVPDVRTEEVQGWLVKLEPLEKAVLAYFSPP